MRQTSNINSSLNKKRRLSFFRKVGIISLYVLFLISLLVLGLTSDKVQIKSISVSGNSTVSEEEILKVVNDKLNENYLFIIRTDNFFLLKREEIRKQLLNDFKKIESVEIDFYNLNDMEVSISEREAEYLWCVDIPSESKDCYFMDKTGFIFKLAPILNPNLFFEFFGLVDETDPIGKYYFNKDRFFEINNFLEGINKMGFDSKFFNAVDEHKYEIGLSTGAKIIIDDKKSFEKDLINLQALIDSDYIKPTDKSFEKIKSIDLRYGNKAILNSN